MNIYRVGFLIVKFGHNSMSVLCKFQLPLAQQKLCKWLSRIIKFRIVFVVDFHLCGIDKCLLFPDNKFPEHQKPLT